MTAQQFLQIQNKTVSEKRHSELVIQVKRIDKKVPSNISIRF